MTKSTKKDSPCPCGSGKKYKNCCFAKDSESKQARKKTAVFDLGNGNQIKRKVISLDSVPTHNTDALKPDITKEQMIALVLDRLQQILSTEKVSVFADLTNRAVSELNIVPTFTYRELGKALQSDSRFENKFMQLVCLAGSDPVELFIDKYSK
jgi:hypothetical protein